MQCYKVDGKECFEAHRTKNSCNIETADSRLGPASSKWQGRDPFTPVRAAIAGLSWAMHNEVLWYNSMRFASITTFVALAPGRVCHGYCRKYCEGSNLEQKLGHV